MTREEVERTIAEARERMVEPVKPPAWDLKYHVAHGEVAQTWWQYAVDVMRAYHERQHSRDKAQEHMPSHGHEYER